MRIILFVFGNLFSHFFLSCAKIWAEAGKSEMFKYNGISIWCPKEQKDMIKEALDTVMKFYQDEWESYKTNIKKIIISAELNSITWISRRAVVIKNSDRNRLCSPIHLASWLVFDYEKIQTYKTMRCDQIAWNYRVFDLAYQNAESARKKYLADR